jgi:UDP-N-acetylmuramoyl-L-alanyl-D-glutamate--2,6-diaminopimelate ligase
LPRVTLDRLIESDASLPPQMAGVPIEGLTADSRAVKPGFLFAALPGTAVDGARFIPAAVAAGAAAVISATPAETGAAACIVTGNPRRLFALAAARFFGRQPRQVVAVTGTSGKTSVATFVREIWTALGVPAASLGTVGVVSPAGHIELEHTTPDPVKLHEVVARLAADGVDHLAIEASSHGLAQYRLDGLRIAAGAFTNLSHDHLDYHATKSDYFNAKMRLFEELLAPGAPAVINMDSDMGGDVLARAHGHRLAPFTVGREGRALKLVSVERDGLGQRLLIEGPTARHSLMLPLVGDFQASNALVAAGLVIATGGDERRVMQALEGLKGASGRLELVARTGAGAPVFVDYAHKPDALENAVRSIRPYVKNRLHLVFGCGGDRDRAKRPIMGEIAARLADAVYVTDDNPRTEDPASIRAAIMAACPGAVEIGSRAAAIRAAVDALAAGDALVVAGKGHEEGQKIGKVVLPFSDHEAVKAAIAGVDYHG